MIHLLMKCLVVNYPDDMSAGEMSAGELSPLQGRKMSKDKSVNANYCKVQCS